MVRTHSLCHLLLAYVPRIIPNQGRFFQDNEQRWVTPVKYFDWATELNEQGIEWYECK